MRGLLFASIRQFDEGVHLSTLPDERVDLVCILFVGTKNTTMSGILESGVPHPETHHKERETSDNERE